MKYTDLKVQIDPLSESSEHHAVYTNQVNSMNDDIRRAGQKLANAQMDETFYRSFIETTSSTIKHLNAYKTGADTKNSLTAESKQMLKTEEMNSSEIVVYKIAFKDLRKRFENAKDKQHSD